MFVPQYPISLTLVDANQWLDVPWTAPKMSIVLRPLASPQPSEALYAFASALKKEGMAQEGILELFTDFLRLHRDDADERLYDAIADTLDHIHYHFQHL